MYRITEQRHTLAEPHNMRPHRITVVVYRFQTLIALPIDNIIFIQATAQFVQLPVQMQNTSAAGAFV